LTDIIYIMMVDQSVRGLYELHSNAAIKV